MNEIYWHNTHSIGFGAVPLSHSMVLQRKKITIYTDSSTWINTSIQINGYIILTGSNLRDSPEDCPGYWQKNNHVIIEWGIRTVSNVENEKIDKKK